jgi:hypothetical protein
MKIGSKLAILGVVLTLGIGLTSCESVVSTTGPDGVTTTTRTDENGNKTTTRSTDEGVDSSYDDPTAF